MKQKLTTLDLARLNKRRSAIEQEMMCQWDFAHDANDNPAATDKARRYVENFPILRKSGAGLLLFGASGSGKSYMAAEIVNALTDKGYRCKFITTLQLLFRYNNLAYENRNYFLEQFFEQDLIILDDFGMEANTAGNGQILLYIVSTCRLLRIPVIVTTPYHKEVLMKEMGKGPFHAVVKRLMEICVPFTVPMPPNRCQRNLQQKKETETMLDLNPAAEPGLFAEPAEACPETTVTACLPEAVQQTLPL